MSPRTSVRTAVLAVLLVVPSIAFAAGRDLAPRPLGPSAYSQQTPLVAFAGGKYLTLWLETLNLAGWRSLGAFSDAEGKRISQSAFVVLPFGIAGSAHLLGTGDSFALFFPHVDGIRMLDLDLNGAVTADRVVPVEGIVWSDFSIAWNGSHFVVLERHTGGARALFLNRDGMRAHSIPLPCRATRHKMLAVRADAIVAGVCDDAMRLDRIDASGNVTSTPLDASFIEAGVVAAPVATHDALLAWSFPADESLRTMILSADGSVSPLHKIAQGGFGQPLVPVLLAKTANGFLLPFTVHGNLRVSKLNEQGLLVATNDGPANSVGLFARAATDGSNLLVSDLGLEFQGTHIRTRLVDADTEIGAPTVVSIVPARQMEPLLAAGSGTLLAAWTERQGATTTSVKTARIATDGAPLAHAVIATNAKLAGRDLAWNGAEYLAIIHANGELRAQRISAFGLPAGESTFLANFPSMVKPSVAVVWTDDHWEVAWIESAAAFRAEIAPNGARSAVQPLTLEGPLPDSFSRGGLVNIALAYDGERVFMAWTESRIFTDCRVTCIGTSATFLATLDDMTPHPVADPWEHFQSLAIATNGSNIVVLGNGYSESHAVSFDASLHPIASRTFYGLGDVTWDGSTFVVALREWTELTVRRLDASLRDAARARVARIAHPDTDESEPSIAVAVSGNAIIGVQEVEPATGARAVAYIEQEIGHEPQRRRAARR